MKTSLDLPDEMCRRVKSKSALEGRAVREVATALFSAWVDGRVLETGADVTDTNPETPNPGQEWLVRWRELGAAVTKVAAGSDGPVDDLGRDRR